jgi:hypothetical protein
MVSDIRVSDIPSTVGQAVKQGERAPFFRHGQKSREIIPMGDELSWVD